MPRILESIAPELWLIAGGLALLIAAAGFAVGRRTGSRAQQIRDLEGALDDAHAQADGARSELERYRGRVSDHFAETSDKLRDLTLQYRSVYDHLAAGANALCPEGFEQLEGRLATETLPGTLAAEELETDGFEAGDLEARELSSQEPAAASDPESDEPEGTDRSPA